MSSSENKLNFVSPLKIEDKILINYSETKPFIQKVTIDGHEGFFINTEYYKGVLQIQNDKEALQMKLDLVNKFYNNEYQWTVLKNNTIGISIGINLGLLVFIIAENYLLARGLIK